MAAPRGFYRRGGIWWYRTDPLTRRATSTRSKTQAGAIAWLRRREELAADPRHAAAEAATVGEWIQRTLKLKAETKSPATLEVYQQKLGHIARLFGAGAPLSSVTPQALDAYLDQRRAEGVTDLTISKELTCLRQVLKLAKRSHCYPEDLDALRPPALRASYVPQTRALTPPELMRLLAELEPSRGAYVALCVGLGVRRGEVERLLPSDVDLVGGTVFIGGTKTLGARRTVPILPVFRPLLEAAAGYLPVGSWGNAIRDLAAACRRTGIERVTRNDLRRTHATWLVEAGVDRDVVRRLLGHSSTAMVDRVYGKPSPAALGVLAEGRFSETVQDRYSAVRPSDGNRRKAALAQLVEQRFRKPKQLLRGTEDLGQACVIAGSHLAREAHASARSATETLQSPGVAKCSPAAWSLAYAARAMGVLRAA